MTTSGEDRQRQITDEAYARIRARNAELLAKGHTVAEINDAERLGILETEPVPGVDDPFADGFLHPDYVANAAIDDAGNVHTEYVLRGYQQLAELNAIGGVDVLGGSEGRLEQIELALDSGDLDLDEAVARYGSIGQKRRLRRLKAVGLVS
jgi:hypothetical protein